MKICPECKGKKKFKYPSDNPLDVYATDGETVYEIYKCHTCKGTGKVSALTLAVYKARGGPASASMRGFA